MDLKSSMALSISPLQQLLEDINFQRKKELRNLMKDDSGFVVLHGNTQWTEIFVRHFLFQTRKESAITEDDLLFFVRKKYVKGSCRNTPKYETEIEVFRKDSKKLPIGDPDVDWEETVYLNLVIHQFHYYLTLAICTRTSPKELQVLKRHSQRVYASPSRRKMDTKGESEEITFPHICFMVDNFDEVFSDILVRDGEMVCVELVAKDLDGSVQGVIFLGSIRYDALKKVYDARQSSLSSKMTQRMTFGLFSSAPQTRCEFVRMKGPQGKGFAEMAVQKPKGSGIETPTSEPGFCMTDMWDSEYEDEIDEFYDRKHQRRLSDPSSNLNNFANSGWRTKQPNQVGSSSKAMSQNEGLDSLANEISEIEAGDVRDDRPASSASESKLPTSRSSQHLRRRQSETSNIKSPSSSCCACFPSSTIQISTGRKSLQLSEVYCPTCNESPIIDSPFCLTTISRKKLPEQTTTLLDVESEIEYSKNFNKKLVLKKPTPPSCKKNLPQNNGQAKNVEYEIACEAGNEDDNCAKTNSNENSNAKIAIMTEKEKKNMVRVDEEEEMPSRLKVQLKKSSPSPFRQALNKNFNRLDMLRGGVGRREVTAKSKKSKRSFNIENNNETTSTIPGSIPSSVKAIIKESNDSDDNNNSNDDNEETEIDGGNIGNEKGMEKDGLENECQIKYSTLPMVNKQKHKKTISIPQRTTADGTKIFYLCDVPKKLKKELDDGQYNPLWTTKGSTQVFHFWKENRRQSSTPLHSFLTYVSLPWFSIAKDLLDHREMPILTF